MQFWNETKYTVEVELGYSQESGVTVASYVVPSTCQISIHESGYFTLLRIKQVAIPQVDQPEAPEKKFHKKLEKYVQKRIAEAIEDFRDGL